MSASEQEIAAIKARWATAPRQWEQIASLVGQAPQDVRCLLALVDGGSIAQYALSERVRQLEQENAGLRQALGFPTPPRMELEAPALPALKGTADE